MTNDSNGLEAGESIDLAHQPSFALGGIRVDPPLRQLIRVSDGAEEIVEPRVMQVLVALARANGAIVTRDALVRLCWGGRFVGEDAINRALSRVRRLAEGIGEGSFTLETITKVGYRLLAASSGEPAPPAEDRDGRRTGLSRRTILAGIGGGAALLGAGAAAVMLLRLAARRDPMPSGVAPLMQQALIALSQQSREGNNQAIGVYRRVVAQAPAFADGWGALAYAYAHAASVRESGEARIFRERARAAAGRALALEHANGLAQAALAINRPTIGNWLPIERALRHALRWYPDQPQLLFTLAMQLGSVGRFSAALPLGERVAALLPPSPNLYYFRIRTLWGLNRLEEVDRMMAEAASIYPTQFGLWFLRFYIPMFSGRPGAAIALAEDRDQRPTGISAGEFESITRVARAIERPTPAGVDAIIAEQMQRARLGAGYAENAIQFACALGRLDSAFAIAEAYYFGRGFEVPEIRFTPEQGSYSPPGDRMTAYLFMPVLAPMRADPRFGRLVEELGLAKYWKETGSRPDYQL
jgi:DNA-binding winged helix-turn-helix (wHTH) protein/tetratricopeptide (TPR) repeat protein